MTGCCTLEPSQTGLTIVMSLFLKVHNCILFLSAGVGPCSHARDRHSDMGRDPFDRRGTAGTRVLHLHRRNAGTGGQTQTQEMPYRSGHTR